ncbi:MAG: aspartyl protease family protein [Saprospiraceae bacterium]
MGMVYADIELQNGDDVALNRRAIIGEDEIRQINISMMVDSGALMLTINEEIRLALGLEIIDYRSSQLANGMRLELPVAGSVVVRFAGRFCTTNALVLPDDNEPLLGAIPMEEMDLWLNPARNLLTPVHPEGPVMSLR